MIESLRRMAEQKKRIVVGALFLVSFWVWAVAFLSGFARWPDSPLREVSGHYFDKRGHEFSAEQFAAFTRWETNPFVHFGVFIPFALALGSGAVLGLPLWRRDSPPPPADTSDQFSRFYPKFMVGVVALAFIVAIWWFSVR